MKKLCFKKQGGKDFIKFALFSVIFLHLRKKNSIRVWVGVGWPAKIAASVDGMWAKANDYFGRIFFLFRFFHRLEKNENDRVNFLNR